MNDAKECTVNPREKGGYTEGPWRWEADQDGAEFIGAPAFLIGDEEKEILCLSHTLHKSDANLIASAPELLEALAVALHVSGASWVPEFRRHVRDLIIKATKK
jgi:hypothetical protein